MKYTSDPLLEAGKLAFCSSDFCGPPVHREEDCVGQSQECPSISACVYCLCFLSSHTHFSLILRMGQAQSTSLGLVLHHFKDFCHVAEDSGLVVCPSKLTISCRIEWLTYKVGWPGRNFLSPYHLQGKGCNL